MSFFKNIFSDSASEKNNNNDNINDTIKEKKEQFLSLNTISQFDEIDEISYSKPVVLFKHSTRCIISRTALKQFEAEFNYPTEIISCYILDLLNHRDVSNEIAHRYNVTHQSPQIIVIKNGKAIFNESHDSISAEDLKQFV